MGGLQAMPAQTSKIVVAAVYDYWKAKVAFPFPFPCVCVSGDCSICVTFTLYVEYCQDATQIVSITDILPSTSYKK